MKRFLTHFTSLAAFVLLAFTATTIHAATVDLTDANTFPNPAFRTALQQALGETSVEATSVTSLDLSNKGITSIVGIEKFTELETLILDDNQIPFMNLKSNGKLKVLSLRNNKATTGISATAAASTNKHINLATGAPLEELYMSGCTAVTNFSSISTTYNIKSLKILDLKDCSSLTWSPGVVDQLDLVYLDMSNNKGLTSGQGTGINASANLPALKKLETLILANNGLITCVNVSGMTNLKYLDLSGTDFYFKNRQNSSGYFSQDNKDNLEYLNLTNAKMSDNGTDVVDGFVNLKTLLMGGNNTFTSVSINNCPKIETIDISGNTTTKTLSITNSALTATPAITSTSITTLILNDNQLSDIPAVPASVKNLQMQRNNFPAVYSADAAKVGNITGLNLAGNAFTSLSVTNTGLTAITLSGCTSITNLDLSGNAGLTDTNVNSTCLQDLVNVEALNLSGCAELTYADVSKMSNLETLNLSGTDLYFATKEVNYLKPANNPLLKTFIADNCNWSTAGAISGFTNLKTVSIKGNKMAKQEITNCPALESVDVSDNVAITELAITGSQLTAVPTMIGNNCPKLFTVTLDNNLLSEVPAVAVTGATVKYLSMKNNQFPATYAIDGNTQYEGLDLGNNGFTSLTVENSAMSALSLASNASLTELHLHGNDNLTKTASATGISAAQGLYIKGLTALKVLDIENSNFSQLGQENSTNGCTGLETLKAANNKFTTFSNAYKTFGSQGDNGYRPATPTRSSLEHLTGLKYLDLSNNLLQDSLHLRMNTLLETLIVRNNRTITEYSDNSVVKKQFHTPGDVGEFNDTTGLRMLNLIYNTELKYIDISYTGIHHFARDGRFDNYKEDYYMANFAKRGSETTKNREPHYLLITNCNKLEEFYADHNGMKSAAFIKNFEGHNFPYLKRISMIETRGQDSYAMQGSWNPNGSGGCPNLEYINVANSDLDSIGVTNNKNLKYLNVSGNWTKNNWSHWSSTGVGHTLNLKGCDALVECVADDCPHLVIAQANDKTNLTSLSLNNNPELKQVYVPNTGLARIDAEPYGHPDANPDTRTQQAVGNLGLAGLNTAANLELLYCEDNDNLTSLDVTANSNLKYLHAYNNAYGADGLNLSQNNNIVTAWVSNSGLTSLQLNGATALDTLKCYDNAALEALDVRASSNMRYLDLARCHVKDLDLASNSALVHFDCSNNEKCDENHGNWISDLNFTSQALKTVVANNNNLYNITLPASLPSLTRMEFAHNHINGIDLSGATSLAREAIVDEDNGRAITAECAVVNDKTGVKLYYFQLDEDAGTKGGEYLGNKISSDKLKDEYRPALKEENFKLSNVTWDNITNGDNGIQGTLTGSRKAAAIIDNIDPQTVVGTIAVLSPSQEGQDGASGRAEYTYNNGRSNSTFYLDWTAAANIVTAIDDVTIEAQPVGTVYYNLAGQPSDTPHQGVNIVVTKNTDGSTTTTKVIK